MKMISAPIVAAAPAGLIDVPRHICDAIAERLSGVGCSTSGAVAENKAAVEVVRVAESLVLAALPKRVDEERLAEILRIAPRELHAAFAAVRGATTYRSLMGVRLEAARQVLALYPNLSPVAVAKQCGFAAYGRFLGEWATYFGPDVLIPKRTARGDRPVRLKARGRRRADGRASV